LEDVRVVPPSEKTAVMPAGSWLTVSVPVVTWLTSELTSRLKLVEPLTATVRLPGNGLTVAPPSVPGVKKKACPTESTTAQNEAEGQETLSMEFPGSRATDDIQDDPLK